MISANTRSDIREELHRERKRLLVLAHLLVIGGIVIYFPYGIFQRESLFLGVLEITDCLLIFINLYLLLRNAKLSLSAYMLLVLVGLEIAMLVGKGMDAPSINHNLYWVVLLVPAAYYLTGRRGGVVITTALLISIWAMYGYFHAQQANLLRNDVLNNFTGVYLAISAISFLYAHSQTLNIRRILHYSQDLAFANDELKVAALTDTLTCSYNRKFLDEVLNEIIHNRQTLRFSLIMIDIDHFKSVNDKHGHQVGDEVLSAVTRGLQSQLRDKDILGRWGGEEFIVISQGLGAEKALGLAERLRKYISDECFPHGLKITCSFGVVEWRANESKNDLIRRADNMLYEAKKSGRNRCVLSKVA